MISFILHWLYAKGSPIVLLRIVKAVRSFMRKRISGC